MADEIYKSSSGRPETAGMTYDEKSRTWKTVTSQSDSMQTQQDTPKKDTAPSTGELKDSQFKAEKDYIEIEYTTLQGDANVLPTSKTIRLKQGKTVTLEGLGKNLSGRYFIAGIRRSLNNSSGYSQSCTFIKTGFGDSLKSGSGTAEYTGSFTGETNRPMEVAVSDTSKIEQGSNVSFASDEAVYAGAHDGVKIPAWIRQKTDLKIAQISSDGVKALLQPINSWTYTKYLKKV